jgi:DNA end-binding protein Ku
VKKSSTPVSSIHPATSNGSDEPEEEAADGSRFGETATVAPDVVEEPVTRVRQEYAGASDESPVPRQDLLRSYEVQPHQYVTFQNEELRKLRLATSPEMEILRSVRLAEIDPVYFDTSYYVVPDRGGERPYALLFAALQQSQYVALAKVAMHGREHILVLRPGQKGLLAHTIFYSNEIRATNEVPANVADVVPKELNLARTFVDAIAGPFAPEEFKDTYQEQVRNLIARKVERQEVAADASPQAASAPVVDILDALKRSLDLARKPPNEAEQASGRTAARAGRSKGQRRKA